MGYQQHQQQAGIEGPRQVRCGVITVSDTRTAETDSSGALIREALTQAGHVVVRYALVRDEQSQIVALVQELEAQGCQVILTSGGTGIAWRDTTYEAIDGLLDKRLPGFGELFRMLSYAEIGAAAMFSRATAGLYRSAVIFCMPGSTAAVRLALEQLIVPELNHLVWEVLRQRP